MSERQLERLNRTLFVCMMVSLVGALLLAGINVDILFWQTPLIGWITYENYLPIITTIAIVTLPFWVVGAMADVKIRNDMKRKGIIQ